MTARRLRLLKRKPTPPPSSHAADRHSAEAVAPRLVAVPLPLPEPEPRRFVAADEPTPIFDAVMNDKWWDVSTYSEEAAPTPEDNLYHALEAQFAVAFALDELTDQDRGEAAARARGTAIVGLA